MLSFLVSFEDLGSRFAVFFKEKWPFGGGGGAQPGGYAPRRGLAIGGVVLGVEVDACSDVGGHERPVAGGEFLSSVEETVDGNSCAHCQDQERERC